MIFIDLNTLSLALRNVLRNRRRSAITLAAIGVAALAIIALGGYISASTKAIQTATVRQLGHLQVMQRGYLDFGSANPVRYAITDYDVIIAKLRSDPVLAPMLAVITPMLQVQGVAGYFANGTSSTFIASSWVPRERLDMLAWDGLGLNFPPSGTRLREDRPEDGVIGMGLAQLLDLCAVLDVQNCMKPYLVKAPANEPDITADLASLSQQAKSTLTSNPQTKGNVSVDLLAAGTGGAPNVILMKVASVEQQGLRDVDRMFVSMPLKLGQRLVFGRDKPGVSAIVIQLHRTSQLAAARARIETIFGTSAESLEVRPFQEISPAYNQIVALFSTMFGFVTILMAVVTLFSVANTMNMAVSERTGEIGSLRAIGLKRAQISRMFVVEGGLIGFAGAVLGVVIALFVSEFGINQAGLHWTPPGNAAPVPISIDVAHSAGLCFSTIGILAILSCLSSWWPARRAARLEIVEALRHE